MGKGVRFMRAALLGLLFVAGTFAFGACGGGASSDGPIRFGMVDWPEAVAKTNVAATIVDALGYL